MVDYKRIDPKLTHLPIESSIRVFTFLKKVLEEYKLNLNMFEEDLSNSSVGERYFIIKYSISYFDYYDPKSYFNIWIKNKERSMQNYDEFSIEKYEIIRNSEILVSYCKQNLLSYKRRFTHILINYPAQYDFLDNTEARQIKERCKRMINGRNKSKGNEISASQQSIRIPIKLIAKFDSGKEEVSIIDFALATDYFKECFKDLMSGNELKKLTQNTLRDSNSDNQFQPLKLLFIEVQSKALLYERIYKFYIFYTKEVKTNLTKRSKSDKEKISFSLNRFKINLENNKEKSLSENAIEAKVKEKKNELNSSYSLRKKFQFQSTNYTKYDFLCAFYFSFPIIRESYFKAKLKNPLNSISDYLNTESRNLKMRKKSN